MQNEDPLKENGAPEYLISTSRWALFFLILVIGSGGIAYHFLKNAGLQNSAALYVGLPFLLALGLSLMPRSKSAMGATMKGITIALLLAAPVFQEGYICILFAAPIFYAVGFTCSLPFRGRERRNRHETAIVSLVFAVMALEGTSDLMTFSRDHNVSVTKTVPAPLSDVRSALAKTPVLGESTPFFLRIFPYPVAMRGSGIVPGDTRRATFVAYKHIFWNRVEGDAVFTVIELTERRIKFVLTSDASYVAHYVDWKTSEVELVPIDDVHTQVTWNLSFHRKYDPYWYFGTLQKYAARLVAEELIDHAATPGA